LENFVDRLLSPPFIMCRLWTVVFECVLQTPFGYDAAIHRAEVLIKCENPLCTYRSHKSDAGLQRIPEKMRAARYTCPICSGKKFECPEDRLAALKDYVQKPRSRRDNSQSQNHNASTNDSFTQQQNLVCEHYRFLFLKA